MRLSWSNSHVSFLQERELYLELNKSDTEPVGEMMILKETSQEEN